MNSYIYINSYDYVVSWLFVPQPRNYVTPTYHLPFKQYFETGEEEEEEVDDDDSSDDNDSSSFEYETDEDGAEVMN